MKTEVFYPLTDDLCFKHIFSKEEVLEDFLNSFFEFINLEKVTLKVKANTQYEMIGKSKNKKVFYGDILVYTNTNKIFSLEMYQKFQKEEFNKSISYITRIFSGQLERGKKYLDAKKVIGLNFINGNYHNNNELVNDYGFINKVSLRSLEDECLEMFLIRLDLVRKKVYNNTEERFIRWLRFISAKDVLEMKKISEGDEVMEQTLQFMEDFLNDEEIRDVYDKINDVERYAKEEGIAQGKAEGIAQGKAEGLAQGKAEGLAQGRAEGEQQERIKTAKNMLRDGLNINNISKYTGLSLSEINALN